MRVQHSQLSVRAGGVGGETGPRRHDGRVGAAGRPGPRWSLGPAWVTCERQRSSILKYVDNLALTNTSVATGGKDTVRGGCLDAGSLQFVSYAISLCCLWAGASGC